MSQAYLSLRHIHKHFGSFTALKDINLTIQKGEFICLLGPSGCGKTTLLRIIAGLESPTEGSVLVGGKEITKLPPAKRNFGMVFQSYALFPNLTAYQNVAYGLHGKKFSRKEIDEKVRHVLELVDLAHMGDRFPAQLSGGQQQRIALARAIVLSPDFLLLDEPLSALDAKVREKLREQICELQEKLGITTVMVTHDQEEALTMADRIVVMNNAEIKQVGTPQEVYHVPASPFVADFIGAINFMNPGQDAPVQGGMAIRPEHVHIHAMPVANGIPAIVRQIEFRGSFYRLTVQVEQQEVAFPKGTIAAQTMIVDISSQAAARMQLTRNANVSLELPANKCIHFQPEKLVLG
ncbi:putative 2-aminoethylphosphonate ABC transporter ATP-binding protein [Paenibacillus lignilyticus]|uniref:2-aminoethylphosphonate ABC transporter ATP-binding protein n=1 Tax=Paenibacillus lignilyticus TaxID=1172615 RepID=A0ABS5CIH3_9BACL|nr:putative 2-aminoethylphosphonate ABC transporter ATP-binding protein [Paenibacillus lignilyticus]MBP3965659.1 putative 2-aminoethylphosphonate ABC transporter ATP-binding protein [Paenibacillus lignilyticus]